MTHNNMLMKNQFPITNSLPHQKYLLWKCNLNWSSCSEKFRNTLPQIYPEPPQTSRMKSFVNMINNLQRLGIAEKCSILDVCGSPGYVSSYTYHSYKTHMWYSYKNSCRSLYNMSTLPTIFATSTRLQLFQELIFTRTAQLTLTQPFCIFGTLSNVYAGNF